MPHLTESMCEANRTAICWSTYQNLLSAIGSLNVPLGEDFLLQRVKPGIYRWTKSTIRRVRRREALDETTINGFPSMQWRFIPIVLNIDVRPFASPD
jgi:hypothetical protein